MTDYSGVHTINGQKVIWLQNVGYVKAKQIENFRKGDRIAYNWGEACTVVSKKKVTPKFYELKVRAGNGKVYTQRVKVGTYKPYYQPPKR
jgi:hypothetical protein